ncbi:transglycosylase SLT domain-containing protein [Vibrio sp. SS-MA-C1-2]|uniref:transglycosylase SLT domain-containing protein n=1 Tax=Vibrio sp. SS-MA-C1-2 TaxID=2908646 RepID=UPI001F193FA8|nr:transglycosylase SLT domain-containing protein [Vibrio sp. SS-MA-C1-2]UJF19724.1 transglycosylase SLT domain-containing protein [Vibrio sp. SS-MA-C1-2]
MRHYRTLIKALLTSAIILSPSATSSINKNQHYRDLYHQAIESISAGDYQTYQTQLTRLQSYPLTPYLEYRELLTRLGSVDRPEVEAFIEKHRTMPFINSLRQSYLAQLVREDKWSEFLAFQPKEPTSGWLKCRYYQAKAETGAFDQAWQGAEKLWLTGKSTNKTCNQLFDLWSKAGERDDDIILERMLLVFNEGNSSRLKYLSKMLSQQQKEQGDQTKRLFTNPSLVGEFASDNQVTPFTQELTLTAFKRLSRQKPQVAVDLFDQVATKQQLTSKQKQYINDYLARQLIRAEEPELIAWRDQAITKTSSLPLIEQRIRLAIEQGELLEAKTWINKLPEKEQSSLRWTFWQAKAAETNNDIKTATILYQSMLGERNFYSAMAAFILNKPIEYPIQLAPLINKKSRILLNPDKVNALARVDELLDANKILAAKREWEYLLTLSTSEEMVELAAYAAEQKWSHFTVQATIRGKMWDYMDLRFPLGYHWLFDFFAKENQLSPPMLMALARQESALYSHAQSYVGARGLMQLMPATAKETAKKLKHPYKGPLSLRDPTENIRLGSAYIKEMLGRYDDNRILAFASYNAGPGRVSRWLKRTDSQVDIYSFIESIPYKETRGYVQNVLMFELYYSRRLGLDHQFLSNSELKRRY